MDRIWSKENASTSAREASLAWITNVNVRSPVLFATDTSFSDCPADCDYCTSPKQCVQCRNHFHLHNDLCVHTCPLAFASVNGTCTRMRGQIAHVVTLLSVQNAHRDAPSATHCLAALL